MFRFGHGVRRKEIMMRQFDEDMILGYELLEEILDEYTLQPQRTQEEEDQLIKEMENEHEGKTAL